MNLQFIDRGGELETLERLLIRRSPSLVLIYGRRRIGKTRLIQEFLRGKRSLYFYTPNAEERTILSEFSKVAEGEFFQGFKFSDFGSFLDYLGRKCGAGFIIAIDEFQRLTNIDGAISMLQRHWDEMSQADGCLMILSGSSFGAIRRVALRGDAPLYGRRTATLKVASLKYLDLLEWFGSYSSEEVVKVYGGFGGTPAYLEHVDESQSPEENIVEKILSRRAPLHDEPEMLLMEEIRTPQRYLDILTAIARGKNTVTEIANFTGISRENTTTYLKTLSLLDLIDRITPVTDPLARRGLYRIMDPFFAFWFRFVRPNERQLELGLERNVWEGIEEEFNMYLGHVFENIGFEIIVEMSKEDMLPLKMDKVGRWWLKDAEIDLLGLERRGNRALAIETKWAKVDYKEAKRLLSSLEGKMHMIEGFKEQVLGIIARKIENKETLRDEGFIAIDLKDLEEKRHNLTHEA